MTTRRVWHVWPTRNWPASPTEEDAFVADLDRLATADHRPRPSRPHPPTRPDVTAVLNALRSGATAREVTSFIPGTPPAALAAAYRHLADRLTIAVAAWNDLVADPTLEAVHAHASAAAVILPVPVYRIVTVAANAGHLALADTISELDARVRDHQEVCRRVEHDLVGRRAPDPVAVALGARLHNPIEPALWGSPYFLPTRVTSLSPTRVADLLEERALP